MSSITVRQMELSDYREVSVLVCATYEWAGRREDLSAEEIQRYALGRGTPETIRSNFISRRCWVATQSERMVGVIMTQENRIEKLYIDASSIGRGIGRRLFRKAEQAISQDGCEELTLWAVFDSAIPEDGHASTTFTLRIGDYEPA